MAVAAQPRPILPTPNRLVPGALPAPRPAPGARLAALLILLAIVALAAALRLPHLATNPGWDGDEGYNVNIAWNLAHGRHQMFALDFAFVQHPPLFFALGALLFHLTGAGILTLRLLSLAFCLGTLALLPALALQVADAAMGWRIGLLAALAYAVLPLVALQNRFGYTYNGLAFWTVLALLGALRYRRGGGWATLILCGAATTAALSTDQEGIYLLPILLFGLGRLPFARRCIVVGVALAGPALYLSLMALSNRAALLFDLTHTANRVAGGSLLWQGESWLYALADLMRVDPAIPLGLAGLALLPSRPARRVTLGLLAALLLVILKVRDPNPLFRTAEPLLPLVCLGLGTLGAALWARCEAMGRRIAGARAAIVATVMMAAFVAPASIMAVSFDAHAAATRWRTPIEGLLPRSTAQSQGTAAWLNARLHGDDVVLAMPQVSWLLHARTAEILQAVAITGRPSAFYAAGIPASRWVYDVRLAAARFLIVDDFTRAWIAQNAPERALVRRAEGAWRLVYARGEYRIYENPAHVR